tara:strand:- start:2598 stop:4544 length:1947 start_codon:yes stop_codon:yes gene_type:complete
VANVVDILVKADGSKAITSFDKVRKAVMGVSLAVAGVSIALVKIGDDINKAGRNIQASTGATGKELEALNKSFKEVAKNVPQDFDAVSKAVGSVSTELGLTGNQLEKTTKQFLDLSRITGTEVEPLIKQVSDSMDLFGIDVSKAGDSMDAFTRASQLTNVPISQLTAKVTEFGPVLRKMGLGMNESISFLGQLEGAGISASRIMPGLNAAMRRIAASGSKDLGESLQQSMRAIRDSTDETEAYNMSMKLFGAEGATRMSIAIQDGTVDIAAMSEALASSQGALEEVNEGTMTSAERFDVLKNKLKLAVEPLASFAANFGPLVIMLPSAIGGIAALAGVTAVQTAMTWLWTAAQTALNIAMGPVGLIILGIVVAVGAAILIWKNWDKVSEVLLATWEKLNTFLSDKFPATWQFIKDYINTVIEFWKEIFQGFVALFKGDWDEALEHFKGAFGVIFDFWKDIFDKIWGVVDGFMTDKFGGAWEKAKTVVMDAVDFIKGVFDGLVTTLKGVFDLIVGIFTGDTDKITEGFKGIVNGIIMMFNALIDLVNTFEVKVPDWTPIIGGKAWSPNIPNIPALADGGIVKSPTLAMIGEAGPEAVVPLGKSGGMGVTVNVVMPEGGTVIMDDESTMQRFSDFITREIRQVLRTQGGF